MDKPDLEKRLTDIQNNIRQIASDVNRDPDQIKLVAVSKNHSVEKIKFFNEKGLMVFGENRVQELTEKDEELSDLNLSWHFIGHLQRNKVKYLMRMDRCSMIHSLDSWRLAKEINKRAKKNNRVIPVLVEVNAAGDENKFGINPEDTPDFINKVSQLSALDIKGLMTIVPYTDDPEKTRPHFRKMYDLKKEINADGHNLQELSMGMSNDYKVAIEEGATIVRIGTALFGQREY